MNDATRALREPRATASRGGAWLASHVLDKELFMYWGYHYWGMHLFWWFFWLALVVLLLSTGWPRSRIALRDGAIDALRTRYAAGEIDEEEYQERLAVLTRAGRTPPRAPDRRPPTDAQSPPRGADDRAAPGREIRS
jgi:putative membrane protein